MMKRTHAFSAVVLLLVAAGAPQHAGAQLLWPPSYVNQWVDVFRAGATQADADCKHFLNAAADGLQMAHAQRGVYFTAVPDIVRPDGTILTVFGEIDFDRGEIRIDAAKSSPNGGVPGTISHERAHASGNDSYWPSLRRQAEWAQLHAAMQGLQERCTANLMDLPVIPESNSSWESG